MGLDEPAAASALIAPLWGVYLFMILLGISYGVVATIFGALWPEVYGNANIGGIQALTVSAMVLATAIGPGINGWLIDAGVELPRQTFWMALWCGAASLALAVAVRSVRRREAPRPDSA